MSTKATPLDDTIAFSGIVSSAIDLGPSRNFSLPMRLRLLQKSSWQDGDLQLVAAALVGEIAKAPGMSSIVRPVGLGREGYMNSYPLRGIRSWQLY